MFTAPFKGNPWNLITIQGYKVTVYLYPWRFPTIKLIELEVFFELATKIKNDFAVILKIMKQILLLSEWLPCFGIVLHVLIRFFSPAKIVHFLAGFESKLTHCFVFFQPFQQGYSQFCGLRVLSTSLIREFYIPLFYFILIFVCVGSFFTIHLFHCWIQYSHDD